MIEFLLWVDHSVLELVSFKISLFCWKRLCDIADISANLKIIDIDIDKAILKDIDIDKEILENTNIDKEILKNIDIDKKILENINIDKMLISIKY